MADLVGRLLPLNVGMPRDIEWEGRTVRTGIWKSSVEGRRMVRRLNVDGDGHPLEPPALGGALLCCSQPSGEIALDL